MSSGGRSASGCGQEDGQSRPRRRNGYSFDIDRIERSRRIAGDITLNPAQGRSRRAQREAGRPDRRTSDDGGHYIARRFNGPTDAFNHFAQNAESLGATVFKEGRAAVACRGGIARLGDLIDALWRAQSPAKKRVEMEYVLRGKRLKVTFRYPEEIGPTSDFFARRARSVRELFGRKPVVCPDRP